MVTEPSIVILTIIALTKLTHCQLRTDEVEPTAVIQPPLVQSMSPSQSFNNSEKLFENVGLYLFKRKIHIEEFYYSKDNSSTPPNTEQLEKLASSAAGDKMSSMVQPPASSQTLEALTRPPPPTTDRSNMLSFLAKRESGVNASQIQTVPSSTPTTTAATPAPTSQATQPSTTAPSTTSTTSKPTSQFRPFSFSVTSTPMRQMINSGNGNFRLPSILDRFRRPSSTTSTTANPVESFFLTLKTSAPSLATSAAPTTPSTTTTTTTRAAPPALAVATSSPSPPFLAVGTSQPPSPAQPQQPNPTFSPLALANLFPTTPAPQPQTTPFVPTFFQPFPPPQPPAAQPPPFVPTFFQPNPPVTQAPVVPSPAPVNSSAIAAEINTLALSRRRFRFKDLSSGEFLNETTPECKKQLRQTDNCLKNILLISSDIDVPRTEGQLNATYCTNLNSTLKCLGGYSKCLTRVPRIMYNFVYLSLKRQLQEICTSTTVKQQLILHANCFQNETDKKVLRDLSSRGTLTAVFVLQNVPSTHVIQWGCCGFFKMFEDGKKAIDDLCTKRTGSNTGKWIMDLVMKSAADLLEIGCLRYSSVKSCRKHLPGAIETFEALTGGDIPDQKYSPVIPLIEIARKLGSGF